MIISPKGFIKGEIRNKGEIKTLQFPNQALNGGKEYLANSLLESSKKLWIANVLFGDGGEGDGGPKEVLSTQDKLNGVIRLRKPVVAQIDPEVPTQVIFAVVINEDEGNDFVLNEMGLELNDETLFSLATFPNLTKTDQMEISWLWHVQMI